MFKSYAKNKDGNFSIMFAVAVGALLMCLAVAVDLSSAYGHSSKLQDLADSAVLSAAVSGEQDEEELQIIATDSVDSNNFTGLSLTTQLDVLNNNALNVTITTSVKPLFMGIFGRKNIDISASAEAPPKGSAPLNLALVLDSTGSMQGSKMTALRTAANNLVDSLESNDGTVQISVVPFARYTRIPRTYDTEPWLEMAPTVDTCWMKYDPVNSVNCELDDDDEGEEYDCDVYVEMQVCSRIEYSGCVASRHKPDHLAADFTSQRVQGYAAGGSCSTEIRPLTTNFTNVKQTINDMEAKDYTYIPSGLIWGWRSLTKQAPMTEANTADFDERKSVMVLMSDGANTRSLSDDTNEWGFNGLYHWGSDVNDANSTTSALCTNIKNDGIDVYTVAFGVTDSTTLSLLQNCATSLSQFYPASNAAQLNSAFETIGKKLAQVRLSK